MAEVPSNYKTAGILMLIAGILNILISLVMIVFIGLYGAMIAAMTMGVGIVVWCCCLIPVVPLAVGIIELVTGINVMNGKPMAKAGVISIVGIVVGALGMLSGGIGTMPMILEIIATVMLNDNEVKAWLETASEELLLED